MKTNLKYFVRFICVVAACLLSLLIFNYLDEYYAWAIYFVSIVFALMIAGVNAIGARITHMERKVTDEMYKVAEVTNAIIITLDNSLRIRYLNPMAKNILSKTYGSNSIIGRSILEISIPGDLNRCEYLIKKVIRTGISEVILQRYDDANGEEQFQRTSIYATKGGIVILAQSITELKRYESKAREYEHSLKELFYSIGDTVIAILPDGSVESIIANENRFPEFLKSQDFVGFNFRDVLPDSIVERVEAEMTGNFGCRVRSFNFSTVGVANLKYQIRTLRSINNKFIIIINDVTNEAVEYAKIKESETKMRRIVESAHEGIIITNPTGDIMFANPRFCDIIGYTIEQVLKMKLADMLAAVDMDENRFNIETEIGKTSNFEIKLNDKYNNTRWCSVLCSSLKEENGKYCGTLLMINDVTFRKEMEAEMKKNSELLKAIIANSHCLIYMKDMDRRYTLVNDVMVKYFDRTEQAELIGRRVDDIMPKEFYGAHVRNDDVVYSTKGYIYTEEKSICNGKEHTFVATKFPLLDANDNIYGLCGISLDISTQVEAKKQIEKSEREYKELNTAKDKFFSIIAHDMRSPVYNFREITKLLLTDYHDLNEEARRSFLEVMLESADGLCNLMENLLVWSRTQTGKITLSLDKHNLCDTVRDMLVTMKPTALKKHIEVVNLVTNDVFAKYDDNYIGTVIRNLFSNAVKFTNDGGKIIIGTKDNPNIDDNKKTIVYIKDNGVGMDENTKAKVFRIDAQTTLVGTMGERGSGFGLVLCKEFVAAHEGTIWFESTLGEGTTFFFTI